MLVVPALFAGLFLMTDPLAAAPAATNSPVPAVTGPTLHFDYGSGQAVENPLSKFMYFVPLISPDPIAVSTNVDNSQRARVLSSMCHTNGTVFKAMCEFEFLGNGTQRDVFDHAGVIRRHDQDLKAGKPIRSQLDAVNVEGAGTGMVEVSGMLTNGRPVASEVRMRFNTQGHVSPVSVTLHDLVMRDGTIHQENEVVARVNELVFYEKAGTPKMEFVLASVKPETASDSFWQNCMGKLRGVVANLLIPPLTVPRDGHQTMMNFGQALAMQEPSFTFPCATRLEASPASKP